MESQENFLAHSKQLESQLNNIIIYNTREKKLWFNSRWIPITNNSFNLYECEQIIEHLKLLSNLFAEMGLNYPTSF